MPDDVSAAGHDIPHSRAAASNPEGFFANIVTWNASVDRNAMHSLESCR